MPEAMGPGWTDERVAALKRLWADGFSASQVAKALGRCTRNAVIGKVHRLGLSGTRSPEPPVRRRALRLVPDAPVRAAERPAPVLTRGPLAEAPEPRHLTLMQLGTGVCRWPIGDGEAMTFCGCATPDATDPVQPYCAFHRARAFQPRKPRLLTCNTLPSRGAHKATRSEMFRQAAGGR